MWGSCDMGGRSHSHPGEASACGQEHAAVTHTLKTQTNIILDKSCPCTFSSDWLASQKSRIKKNTKKQWQSKAFIILCL